MNFEFLNSLNKSNEKIEEGYFPKSVGVTEISIESYEGDAEVDDPDGFMHPNDPDRRDEKVVKCKLDELTFEISVAQEKYFVQYVFSPSLDLETRGELDESKFKSAIRQHPFILYNDDGDIINDDLKRQNSRSYVMRYVDQDDKFGQTTLEDLFDALIGR